MQQENKKNTKKKKNVKGKNVTNIEWYVSRYSIKLFTLIPIYKTAHMYT